MKLDARTKHLALGGAVGVAGTAIVLSLFGGSRGLGGDHRLQSQPHHDKHGGHGGNGRGEYGKKKHHHHKGHGG